MRVSVAPLIVTAVLLSAGAHAQSPLCLAGCVDAKVNTEHFVQTSKNLVEAVKELAKFDALGVKTLLAQNAALQLQLAQAAMHLSGYQVADPVIQLSGQLLKFRVANATGNFKVTIWIDDRKNVPIVFQRPVLDQKYDLALPTGDQVLAPMLAAIRRAPLFQHKTLADIDMKAVGARNLIDQQNATARQQFTQFLSSTQPVPIPNGPDIDLNQVLLVTGTHSLFIEVTPIANNAQGRWAFEGRLVISRPGADDLVPMQFAFDSADYPAHPLKQPLPPRQLFFAVK
jgi:hypothetical protein